MPLSSKRRRGRPRRGEGPTLDHFDLALAREFQQRPAFYDRTHPQYRNREYLEPLWLEMANNLGHNVALVKTRIVQLRNRYNLEKRRVEGLQEQYNDPDITSQWPMYEHLTYLGDHIKSRGSYGRTSLVQPKIQPNSGTSESDDCDNSNQYETSGICTRRQGQRRPVIVSQMRANTTSAASNHRQSGHTNGRKFNETSVVDNPLVESNAGVYKFKAFGQFLTSSLIEMNEIDALHLVEKFTSELVKSLLSEQKPKHQNNDVILDGLVNGHD